MISRLALGWLTIVIAVLVVARFLPGQIQYSSYEGIAAFALVLVVLNTFIAPVLKVLTLPLTLLTFGLFSIVLNALLFWFAAEITGPLGGVGTVTVTGFLAAVVAALVVSIVGVVVRAIG